MRPPTGGGAELFPGGERDGGGRRAPAWPPARRTCSNASTSARVRCSRSFHRTRSRRCWARMGGAGHQRTRSRRAAVDRVPGEVERALHELGVGARHAAARVQDRAHQARPLHRDLPHAPGLYEVDAPRVGSDVPRVFDPARRDDLPRGLGQVADAGELGQPGAERVELGQPAPRSPPRAPAEGGDVRSAEFDLHAVLLYRAVIVTPDGAVGAQCGGLRDAARRR